MYDVTTPQLPEKAKILPKTVPKSQSVQSFIYILHTDYITDGGKET